MEVSAGGGVSQAATLSSCAMHACTCTCACAVRPRTPMQAAHQRRPAAPECHPPAAPPDSPWTPPTPPPSTEMGGHKRAPTPQRGLAPLVHLQQLVHVAKDFVRLLRRS